MNNGAVQNNQTVRAAKKIELETSGDARTDKNAAHEGGGIYIGGTANIYKGKILNNKTATVNDWGGGGIFVES